MTLIVHITFILLIIFNIRRIPRDPREVQARVPIHPLYTPYFLTSNSRFEQRKTFHYNGNRSTSPNCVRFFSPKPQSPFSSDLNSRVALRKNATELPRLIRFGTRKFTRTIRPRNRNFEQTAFRQCKQRKKDVLRIVDDVYPLTLGNTVFFQFIKLK